MATEKLCYGDFLFMLKRVGGGMKLETISVEPTGLYLFSVNRISLRNIGNLVCGWMCQVQTQMVLEIS